MKKTMYTTPATLAREAAGLSIEDAAKRARICTSYLKRIERPGTGASYVLACRLAKIYGCGINAFLRSKAVPLQAVGESIGGGKKQSQEKGVVYRDVKAAVAETPTHCYGGARGLITPARSTSRLDSKIRRAA